MKNRFALLLVMAFSFVASSAFMCSKEDTTITPVKLEYTSLIGYWKLKSGASFGINEKGEKKQTATMKEGVVAYEFFADGTVINHVLVGTPESEKGNWKLEVKKLEGKDIEDGILTLTSASTKAGAGEVWVDQDGSLRQQISSLDKPTGATKPRIYLVSKRIEVYPYKEAWVETTYEKQ
jgi:hypothetical protein